ncbi:heparinase II/III domain-containing protein [Thermophagus sp. OGC60D27]|uniref:heparinase II/III domain-containing protein n=1 Tax=Thermophagus sp. OGC60D27 TaxID=3458415 RepID=UPI004037F609
MKKTFLFVFFCAFFLCGCGSEITEEGPAHPNLILTNSSVKEAKKLKEKLPLLSISFEKLKTRTDQLMSQPMDVPIPVDPAGGYTHNKHKSNYIAMYGAGVLWQLTGEEKYAEFVKNMLLEYAALYPQLGRHPVKASYAPGKLFWQSLNEAVWLVYTIQAYDCVFSYLDPQDRLTIETNLLRPYVDFLSVESPKVFNRVHNHGVWAVAAVGMTGLALRDDELVERALYGVEGDQPKDKEANESGFLVQLTELFSPDGYYTEGPYYQRYALLPYLLFAQSLESNRPDLRIFAFRDSVLKKAVLTTLQLTNVDGRFFPINDAIKEMSLAAPELVNAVDIIYNVDQSQKELLSIARQQGEVVFSRGGVAVARDLEKGEAKPFIRRSRQFFDGAHGDKGAIGVLRSEEREQAIVMKYASHGMGHGHFDRLSVMFYDSGHEILTDYGAARFVNIEYKHGGRYLPENDTWAQQTIAHNTLVVDQMSQFGGNVKKASKTDGTPWFFKVDQETVKVMSAKELNAYPGISLHRTLALIEDSVLLKNPLIVDVFRAASDADQVHTYDLPFHYDGQILHTNFPYERFKILKAFGSSNGYQHLWNEGAGSPGDRVSRIVFLNNRSFYSVNTEAQEGDTIFFTRLGSNDPEFNLRNEPSWVLRRHKAGGSLFVSTIEAHGYRDYETELIDSPFGSVMNIETLMNTDDYTIVSVELVNNKRIILAISNRDREATSRHHVKLKDDKEVSWDGPFKMYVNE